nr:S-layer homology domain-containing protein [uncultured Agathobaculum sp.]
MRFNKKKMLSGVLATGLALSCLTAPVSALNIQDQVEQIQQQENVMADFTDMTGHWAYDYVARMVQDGLFAGTSATTFSPNAKMSEVQFLTVVLRKAFPNELTQYNAQYTSSWFDGAYRLGLAKGIISQSVYGSGADMNARNITRERMTDIAIKGLEAMGEQTYSNAAGVSARVTDLNDCKGEMRDSMIKAYTMGIIAGTSDTTVSPKQTATRAQGATVLYRFAYPDERSIPDLNAPVEKPGSDLSQPITIYEGQTRTAGESRLAREGDIFVKADGTKVVLKKGPNGVLGEGQGVAPDLGFKATPNGGRGNEVINQERFSPGPVLGEYDTNSVGKPYNNDDYKVNPWTGEGHWGTEWQVILDANPFPAEYGSYNGQISSNGVWVWLADYNTWDLCCNWPDTSYFQ